MADPGGISDFFKIAVSKGFMAATETWVIVHFAAWVATGLAAFLIPHHDILILRDRFHIEFVGVAGAIVSIWYVYATYCASVERCRSVYRLVPLILISAMLGMMALAYLLVSNDIHAKVQMLIVWIMSLYLTSVKLHNVAFVERVSADIKKKT